MKISIKNNNFRLLFKYDDWRREQLIKINFEGVIKQSERQNVVGNRQ